MNDLGISLAWMALQATLLCVTAAAIYFAARRRNTACASPVLCGALVMTIGIAALSFSPWPRWKIASNFVQPVRGAEAAAADAMRVRAKWRRLPEGRPTSQRTNREPLPAALRWMLA